MFTSGREAARSDMGGGGTGFLTIVQRRGVDDIDWRLCIGAYACLDHDRDHLTLIDCAKIKADRLPVHTETALCSRGRNKSE